MEIYDIVDKVQNFPYCPGCGHTTINMALAKAILSLGIPRDKVLIVSDIGCVGLVDKLFNVHTLHTLHGRSTAVASGVKMVDEIIFDNNLKTIVMIGDGGATIGLLHLVEAAKFNVNITVLLHNNFLYGMTGGQHSGLTPEGFITSTTRKGNPFPEMDILKILESSGAPFIARTYSQDRELVDIIKRAIDFNGFSIVEIYELCTGYATRYNPLSGSKLKELLEKKGGKIEKVNPRDGFGKIYSITDEKYEFKGFEKKYEVNIERPFKVIIAGSAGEGVQFSSYLFALSAILCGLNASQKNDNPVTVGSGFSVSEIIISKDKIRYTGIDNPDFLIITTEDGLKRTKKIKEKAKNIIIDESLVDNKNYIKIPSRKYAKERGGPTIFALGVFMGVTEIYSPEIFIHTIEKYGKSPSSSVRIFKEGLEFAKKLDIPG